MRLLDIGFSEWEISRTGPPLKVSCVRGNETIEVLSDCGAITVQWLVNLDGQVLRVYPIELLGGTYGQLVTMFQILVRQDGHIMKTCEKWDEVIMEHLWNADQEYVLPDTWRDRAVRHPY